MHVTFPPRHERRDGAPWWVLGLACAVWLAFVAVANTSRADTVAVDLSACPAPSEEEVRPLLALELRERLLPKAAVAPDDARHVRVECEASVARLSLRDPPEDRVVSLDRVPPQLRARVLALSIAELLQQQSTAAVKPALTPASEDNAAPTAKRPTTPALAPTVASSRFALWAGLEAGATPLFAVGGSVLFRVRLARLFAWASALSFTQGWREIDRGNVRVQSVALRTGPSLTYERGRAGLLLGCGARLGWWLLRGEPDDQAATARANFSSAYVGPALFGGGSVRLGKHALLALELEFAHTMRRVKADVVGGGATTLGSWRSSVVLGAGATW